MKPILALTPIIIVLLLGFFLTPNPDLNRKIVEINGKTFELQHRLFDTYLLHEIK